MPAKWMFFPHLAPMLLAVSSLLLAPQAALGRGAFTDDPDSVFYEPEEVTTLRYQTTIAGVDDKERLKRLESASQLLSLENRPPPTIAALERRVRSDVDRM